MVQQVYDALKEKGYNPVNQLVGYILSEDPTYITTYKGARALDRQGWIVMTCCRRCCAAIWISDVPARRVFRRVFIFTAEAPA